MLRALGFLVLCVALAAVAFPVLTGTGWIPGVEFWRWIDVLLVAIGGAGFFVVAAEAARLIPSNGLSYKENRTLSALDNVRTTLDDVAAATGITFRRSRHTPENADMDGDQARFDRVHQWVSGARGSFDALDAGAFPELVLEDLGPPPADVEDDYLQRLIDSVSSAIDQYTEQRNNVAATRRKLERGLFESLAVLMAPYAVSLTIGLSLLKALYQ